MRLAVPKRDSYLRFSSSRAGVAQSAKCTLGHVRCGRHTIKKIHIDTSVPVCCVCFPVILAVSEGSDFLVRDYSCSRRVTMGNKT